MLRLFIYIIFFLLLNCGAAFAADDQEDAQDRDNNESSENENRLNRSVFIDILLFIPNRVFDILDIVKVKAKVGPGVSLGLAVTEPVSLFLGAHTDIYLGLPGARLERSIPIPLGAEAVAGGSISILNGVIHSDTSKDKESPRKSKTEVGVEAHLVLLGIDVAIDPIEIVDALSGFVLIDLREDDL